MRTIITLAALAALAITANGCALFGGVTPRYVTVIEEYAPDASGKNTLSNRVYINSRFVQETGGFSWVEERDVADGAEYVKNRELIFEKTTDLSSAEQIAGTRATATLDFSTAAMTAALEGFMRGMAYQERRTELSTERRMARDEQRHAERMEEISLELDRLRAELEAARQHEEAREEVEP